MPIRSPSFTLLLWCCWLAQPPRPTTAATVSVASRPRAALPSAIGRPPLRAVLEPKVHQALEQLRVRRARGARRLGEILGRFEIGIGVGFEHVHLALGRDAEIHASI